MLKTNYMLKTIKTVTVTYGIPLDNYIGILSTYIGSNNYDSFVIFLKDNKNLNLNVTIHPYKYPLLHFAIIIKHINFVKYLIYHTNADLYYKDFDEKTAYDYLQEMEITDIADFYNTKYLIGSFYNPKLVKTNTHFNDFLLDPLCEPELITIIVEFIKN